MRTGPSFNPPEPASPEATPAAQQHSAWHSPVPYLFGGLAAMLGLIALALLILACSYWKLSGYLDGGDDADESGDRPGDGKPTDQRGAKPAAPLPEGFVVIMAGDHKPTFLATPISSRASSFNDGGSTTAGKDVPAGEDVDAGRKQEGEVSSPAGDPTHNEHPEH